MDNIEEKNRKNKLIELKIYEYKVLVRGNVGLDKKLNIKKNSVLELWQYIISILRYIFVFTNLKMVQQIYPFNKRKYGPATFVHF